MDMALYIFGTERLADEPQINKHLKLKAFPYSAYSVDCKPITIQKYIS